MREQVRVSSDRRCLYLGRLLRPLRPSSLPSIFTRPPSTPVFEHTLEPPRVALHRRTTNISGSHLSIRRPSRTVTMTEHDTPDPPPLDQFAKPEGISYEEYLAEIAPKSPQKRHRMTEEDPPDHEYWKKIGHVKRLLLDFRALASEVLDNVRTELTEDLPKLKQIVNELGAYLDITEVLLPDDPVQAPEGTEKD